MRAKNRFLVYGVVSIVSIVIILLLPALSEAYTSIQVFGPRCLGDGKFSFTVVNRQSDPLLLKNTQILMTHRDLGTFPVQGAWNKESVYPGTTSSAIAVFTSTTGNLNRSGSYDGAFFYEGCRQPPCRELFRIDHCDEFRYSCELEQLAIKQCFISRDSLWLRFSGLNAGQHEHQEAERGLAVTLDSNARTIWRSIHIDGMTLKQEGPDRYTLQIPMLPKEQLFEVGLQAWKCRDEPIRDAQRCVLQQKPLVDRKLNASMENRDATSSPLVTRQAVPPAPASSGVEESRSRNQTAAVTRPPVSVDEITPENAVSPEEEENEEETQPKPVPRRVAQDQSRIGLSREATIFVIALGAVWFIGIIIVLVLLSKRR